MFESVWMSLWWLLGSLLKPWVAGAVIALVTTLSLASRHLKFRSRAQSTKQKVLSPVVADQKLVTAAVLQVLPVHPTNGWSLSEVCHGLRIFTRPFTSLVRVSADDTSGNHLAVAASLTLALPLKKALSLAVSAKELPCWMDGLPASNPRVIASASSSRNRTKNGDLVQFTGSVRHSSSNESWWREVVNGARRRVANFTEKYAPFLDGIVKAPVQMTTETVERSWHLEDDLSFVFMAPRSPSSLPHHWALLLFTALKEPGYCLATLIMLPKQQTSHVTPLVAGQLCALREHAELKKLKAYSTNQRNFSPHPSSSSSQQSKNHSMTYAPPPLTSTNNDFVVSKSAAPPQQQAPPLRSLPTKSQGGSLKTRNQSQGSAQHPAPSHRPHRIQSEPTLHSSNHRVTHVPGSTLGRVEGPARTAPSSTTSSNPLDIKYASLAWEKSQKLVSIANGTVEDGWQVVGTTKEVFVMKKLPAKGEASQMNSVKGTGVVKVPPEFVMRVLKDPSHTTELDDLLKESRIIHEVSTSVHLVQLLYKPVWPTSPRDFSVVSIGGQLDSQTWISAGVTVDDPRIPLEKGYVRGQLEAGGYVVRSIPDNPTICEVTYAAQVDLKGSIPAFAQNKVAESQPMCVNRLRNLVEQLYSQLKQSPQKMSEFEENFPIPKILSTTSPEAFAPSNPLTPISTEPPSLDAATQPNVGALMDVPQPVHESLHYQPQDIGERELSNSMEEEDLVLEEKASGFHTPSIEGSDGEDDVITSGGGIPPTIGIHIPQSQVEGGGDRSGAHVSRSTFQFQTPASLDNVFSNGQVPLGSNIRGSGNGGQSDDVDGGDDGPIVMERIEAYTPEEIPSDPEGDQEEDEREEEEKESVFVQKRSPSLALKLPQYTKVRVRSNSSESKDGSQTSVTNENLLYPKTDSGVDYRTMANQTAAKVLQEVFHVSNLDLSDPSTFTDQANGWRFSGLEKDVLILSKKTSDSPFASFMGKGIINLPPQVVYDSIRNPQLRFTYDNMLKELHIVKQIEEGLYILHLHHETTQCFVKQSRDFCILVSERSEPNKMLLVGTSIEVPECPVNPNLYRGKIFCSGWVIEPYRAKGQLQTEITYLLQVDIGGVPSTLVNFVSKRQPLAVAYLRDYLTATSLELSAKENH